MDDARAPVLVGVGEETRRGQQWPDIIGPHELIEIAARKADADAGGGVLRGVDSLSVLNIFSWNYNNAPAFIAEMLGLGPGERTYEVVGGNTPQMTVNRVAAQLARGEIEVALVCGAEAVAGKRAARRSGNRVEWGSHPEPYDLPEQREPVARIEMVHRMMLPIITYPLFEPALRVAAGRSPEEHEAFLGELMAPFTEVAAKSEHAWFPEARTAAELVEVSEDNRMISTPYAKRLVAILEVDQGAALLLTTAGKARDLGIAPEKWVYVLGGDDCNDIWSVSERVSYSYSPAMRRCHNSALEAAGCDVDDVAHFDLYSCFPSAVQLACEALGLRHDDPRGLTVTGGLPYFGGAGNDYVTHAIAAMVERLREHPDDVGMCTGLGWMNTKHSAGVYASRKPTRRFGLVDPEPDAAAVDAEKHPTLVDDLGDDVHEAAIDGYSVSYTKEGEPEVALVLARFGDYRTPAATTDPGIVRAMLDGEWLGRTVTVRKEPSGAGHTFEVA